MLQQLLNQTQLINNKKKKDEHFGIMQWGKTWITEKEL